MLQHATTATTTQNFHKNMVCFNGSICRRHIEFHIVEELKIIYFLPLLCALFRLFDMAQAASTVFIYGFLWLTGKNCCHFFSLPFYFCLLEIILLFYALCSFRVKIVIVNHVLWYKNNFTKINKAEKDVDSGWQYSRIHLYWLCQVNY